MSSGRDLLLSGGKKPFCTPPAPVPPLPPSSPPLPSLPPTPSRFHKLLSYRRFLPSRRRSERHGCGPPPLPSLPPSHPPLPETHRTPNPGKWRQTPCPFPLLPRHQNGVGGPVHPSLHTPVGGGDSEPGLQLASPPHPANPCPSSPRPPFFLPFLSPFPFPPFQDGRNGFPLLEIWRLPRPPPLCAAAPSQTCSRGSEGEGPRQPRGLWAARWAGSLTPSSTPRARAAPGPAPLPPSVWGGVAFRFFRGLRGVVDAQGLEAGSKATCLSDCCGAGGGRSSLPGSRASRAPPPSGSPPTTGPGPGAPPPPRTTSAEPLSLEHPSLGPAESLTLGKVGAATG